MNYIREQKGAWTIWLANGFEMEGISNVVELFRQEIPSFGENHKSSSNIWTIHEGGRCTIYGIEIFGKKYCTKMFKDRRAWTLFRTLLGFSKGRRAFKNGLRAIDQNVPVPQVFAYVEKRPFGPSLVIMELLEGAVQMNLLIEKMLAQGIELAIDPCFLRIVESFARFTKDMHERGVSHDDFSPRNVLIVKQTEKIDLKLIDLEDVIFSNNNKKFQSNIDHFDERIARYIDLETLNVYLKRFREFYGDNLNK